MKKFFALFLVIISVALAVPAFTGCSSGTSEAYIKYTLYAADGTKVDTYSVSTDPTEEEVEEIEAEDGSYFEVSGYSGKPTEVVIPDTYGGIPVTSIAQQAIEGARTLTSITIGNNVTTMGIACFLYCVRLEDVTLSENLTALPQSAFAYCTTLKEIVIPDSVTSIGYYAFYECNALTTVTLPESLTVINGYAFQDCYVLTDMVMPDGLEQIGYSAFINCYALTTLNLPDSLTYIGYAAFQDCTGLVSVTLGSGVTHIGGYAFCYCTALTSINIPADVIYIGENAFCSDTALTDVYMDNCFSDDTEKMCYLYTVDLSAEEDEEGYESGYLAVGSDEAKSYLYTTYNYYNDYKGDSSAIVDYAGYIPKGSFEDSEYMATLLIETLAGNTNLGYSSDVVVYWYFTAV